MLAMLAIAAIPEGEILFLLRPISVLFSMKPSPLVGCCVSSGLKSELDIRLKEELREGVGCSKETVKIIITVTHL